MSTTTSAADEDPPSRRSINERYTEKLVAYSSLATKALFNPYVSIGWDLFSPDKRTELKVTLEQRKTELLKELTASGIDPMLFDVLLSNEINRRMKLHFGITFLVFTFIFTAVSYAIVVLDGVYKWGISQVAITALIIETPIQFVGLLYIIARNLFPQPLNELGKEQTRRERTDKST